MSDPASAGVGSAAVAGALPQAAVPAAGAAGGAAAGGGLLSSLGLGAGAAGGLGETAATLGLIFGLSKLLEGGKKAPPPAPVAPQTGGGGPLGPIPPFDARLFSSLVRLLAAGGR